MAKHRPYQENTDIKRIKSQWRKLNDSNSRERWSTAIVQAATAVEIAADLVVRKELQSKGKLDAAFVNCLLEWANGIVEKMDRLILPLFSGSKQFARLKKHKSVAGKIDEKRNAIVQRSKVCTEREATIVINKAKTIIESLVKIYNPGFSLNED